MLYKETFDKMFKFPHIILQTNEKVNRCNIYSKITYTCDHTNNLDICPECYQEVNWKLTN